MLVYLCELLLSGWEWLGGGSKGSFITDDHPEEVKTKVEYSWTLQRKIFPREYPLCLSKLDAALLPIVNLQDERAFTTIRSVAICRTLSIFQNINYAEDWQVKISHFLSRCVNIEKLRLTSFILNHELVQLIFNDHVPPLKTIELIHSDLLLTNFNHLLSKHITTLRQLTIKGNCFSVDRAVEFLHQHSIRLTSLHIYCADSLGPTEQLLLAYLSANGKDLKYLAIENSFVSKRPTHNVLVSILQYCPHLESLTFRLGPEEEVESIRCYELYQTASRLRDISCEMFSIHVNEKKGIVRFEGVYSADEDHTKSLLHVLKEGYLLAMKGDQTEISNNELTNIIEKLGPYLVSFEEFAVEMNDDLVEKIMQTCPRLHTLVFTLIDEGIITDRALQAIANHGSNMKDLEIVGENKVLWSDEAVSNMIGSCSSLVSLSIPFVGYQTVKALVSLPKLQNFDLSSSNWNVDKILQAFLEEKVKWPNTFRHGSVFMVVEGYHEMGGLNIFTSDFRSPFDLECYRLNSMDDNVVYLTVQDVAVEWFTLPTDRMTVFKDDEDEDEEEEEV
eukprot:gene9031-9966_t